MYERQYVAIAVFSLMILYTLCFLDGCKWDCVKGGMEGMMLFTMHLSFIVCYIY